MNKEQQELVDEAYVNYCKSFRNQTLIEQMLELDNDPMTQFMFLGKSKIQTAFSEEWGLKIEERELSLTERMELWYDKVKGLTMMLMWGCGKTQEDVLNEKNIPSKLITVTYKDKTITSYE
jgi:hypothetical protein